MAEGGFPYLARAVGVGALAIAVIVAGCLAEPQPLVVPAGATQVRVIVTEDRIQLQPAVVPAGEVYVVADGGDANAAGHAAFTFIHTGRDLNVHLPLSDANLAALEVDSEAQGLSSDGGWGPVTRLELPAGRYAFILPGDGGPGRPPRSVAVLEVVD
ncbi:hypothetical protein BH20CHL7_BH20CHL7_11290 [soil metagenome]